jgi:hypothetical protein
MKGDMATASAALGSSREALATAEAPIEQSVSYHLAHMPFLWLNIDDSPGHKSLRGMLERNAIALLSNYQRMPLDPPTPSWLGHCSDRELVCGSGLWNQRHVQETHDPAFLDVFEMSIAQTGRGH